jgi:2-methylcitrate dehydratase PrpD
MASPATPTAAKPESALPDALSPMPTLAAYVAAATATPLPDDVAEQSRHHLIDTLSAMVSGSRLLPGERVVPFIRALGGAPLATVIGSDIVTNPINAALANGIMAHADETDDSHVPSLTHPGCAVVAAALAAGEARHRSGAEMLRAVALGYDFCARATLSVGVRAMRAQGRSSHTFGPTFGASAAAAAMLGLSRDEVPYVLSYALQQASGVDCWARDKEHMEKAFDFGGMGARNGVTAAMLVEAGFTGVDDVFVGDKNFLSVLGAEPDPEAWTRDLGSRFEMSRTNIKRWCVGTPIQAALDAMMILIERDGLSPETLASLKVTIHASGARTVNDRTIPDISMQYLLAAMLIDGGLTFASAHDSARLSHPDILALKARMTLVGDPELDANPNRQAILEVTTTDGRQLREHTKAVRGTANNPMTRQEVEDKSRDLLSPVIGTQRAADLIAAIWQIDDLDDVTKLRPLLQA